MLQADGKRPPYPSQTEYHAPPKENTHLPDTAGKYRKLVGDLRYIADSTRPDVAYVVGRLGAAFSNPIDIHCNFMKATLAYLKNRNYRL